jgi:regulator of protease activity HflC (stomatin/prohibitin superfamily)
MKIWAVVLVVLLGVFGNAQEVNLKGITYKVKGDVILRDGADVTSTLSLDEQQEIKMTVEKNKEILADTKKREKNIKKAENKQKSAEKKQKKAEKALKQKEKAQSNFEKSEKKYNEAIEKYEKLKKKGKLSPQDEGKWLEKIEDLKKDHQKAKGKLN